MSKNQNMCLLNYNRKEKKNKHLTYAERTMIETWHNKEHKTKKEMAELYYIKVKER